MPKAIEYAVKVLICLCFSAGRSISAREVAEIVRIPASQAAKTLHFLSWAGLTRSRRGSKGGYVLRQPPEEIHLEQVFKLYQPSRDETTAATADPLSQLWLDASARFEHDWGQLTISELARRTAGQWGNAHIRY